MGMGEDGWSEWDEVEDYRNLVSPICSECGSQLEEPDEIEREMCCVCYDWITRRD